MGKLLVACEESGIVREAFLALGYDAYSCDLLPSNIPSKRHYQCDVFLGSADMVAIENPKGILSSQFRKPTQIVHPWHYGHPELKETHLWLENFPRLRAGNIVTPREQRIWKMAKSPERKKLRSRTFPGIAAAMAQQWGPLL